MWRWAGAPASPHGAAAHRPALLSAPPCTAVPRPGLPLCAAGRHHIHQEAEQAGARRCGVSSPGSPFACVAPPRARAAGPPHRFSTSWLIPCLSIPLLCSSHRSRTSTTQHKISLPSCSPPRPAAAASTSSAATAWCSLVRRGALAAGVGRGWAGMWRWRWTSSSAPLSLSTLIHPLQTPAGTLQTTSRRRRVCGGTGSRRRCMCTASCPRVRTALWHWYGTSRALRRHAMCTQRDACHPAKQQRCSPCSAAAPPSLQPLHAHSLRACPCPIRTWHRRFH